jgi:futalosine hydrolase
MKDCLIIASTVHEIEPFLKSLRKKESLEKRGLNVDLLITGVGLTATTYALTKQVSLKRPDLVIQAGIAGSLEKKIKPGGVYLVSEDRVADEMVIEKKKLLTVYDFGLRKKDQYPYQDEWLKNIHADLVSLSGLDTLRSISVNQISADKKIIRLYRKKYEASLETMEGAALHLVCLSEKIPFLQLRAVSNYAGERDKSKWKFGKSIRELNSSLSKLLKNLSTPKSEKS